MPETTQITGDNFIGSVPSRQGSSTFTVTDRNSSAALPGDFALATNHEIDLAVSKASHAFDEWKSTNPLKRADFLRAIAYNIEGLSDALLERASAETALPIPRLTGERARTTGQLRMFADLIEEGSWVKASIDRAQTERQPLPSPTLGK